MAKSQSVPYLVQVKRRLNDLAFRDIYDKFSLSPSKHFDQAVPRFHIMENDKLVKIDNKDIRDMDRSEVISLLRKKDIGDKIRLLLVRANFFDLGQKLPKEVF